MARRKKNHEREDNPQPVDKLHRPKVERFHLGMEYRDTGRVEDAENVTRRLRPRFRADALGLPPDAFKYPGFRTTARRDLIQKAND